MVEIRVIEIIDEYELIINFGLEDGAKVDQKIKVFEEGVPVKDLFGNTIGTREVTKEILSIYKVYEKFSICRKKKITYDNLLNPTLQLFKPTVEFQKIAIEKSDASYQKFITESPVKIGDKAAIIEQV